MSITMALSRQSSEIDDSSDGGFQFSHPLFAASTTPGRLDSGLEDVGVAHTSPILRGSEVKHHDIKTPMAQPVYTRFGRRQPLGNRTLSSDGHAAETPGHTLHSSSTAKASASVARWKRTGRIGLGPPKRAERQSIDPEEEAYNQEDREDDKENERPHTTIDTSSPRSQPLKEFAGLSKHRSSTSPSYMNRSLLSSRSEHSRALQPSRLSHSPVLQQETTDPVDVGKRHRDSAASRPSLTARTSSGSISPTGAPLVASKESSFARSSDKTRSLHEPTPIALQAALKSIPEPSVPTQQKVELIPLITSTNQKHIQINSKPNIPIYQDHAPPPKMSLDGPAPTAARKAKVLGRIILNGREYTKLDQIGKGGSSKVFRVMAPNGRIFALKRVDFEQADQATILGYKSEIDLLNRMSASSGCDRIIKLFDSEINDTRGRLLMLMEAGEIDLAHMLTKRQNDSPDFNFIRLFWRHMLEAVQAVHEQKIVHSDLKPANFLLVEGSLKLIDFGIAKAIGNDTTNIHRDQQIGTVNYMSPEALCDTGGNNGRIMKLGRASDVWSLGCILYQMVYGRTPFSHLTMIQKIQAIPSAAHRIEFPSKAYPPSTMNDKVKDESNARIVDGDLLRVMRGCLERDQKLRLTIEQLLNDPFLRPGEKTTKGAEEGTVRINLQQITELLRLTVYQTREKTLQKETVQRSDIDNLARDFYDRLRWAS